MCGGRAGIAADRLEIESYAAVASTVCRVATATASALVVGTGEHCGCGCYSVGWLMVGVGLEVCRLVGRGVGRVCGCKVAWTLRVWSRWSLSAFGMVGLLVEGSLTTWRAAVTIYAPRDRRCPMM